MIWDSWVIDEGATEPRPARDMDDALAYYMRRQADPWGSGWWVAKFVGDGVEVSTVFLGRDHSFPGQPGPILYETLVFGGEHVLKMERYATREQALEGHERMVALVTGKRS